MSYHIISIDSPECHLTVSKGQLICQSADGERKIAMEDVAALVVTSFKATFTQSLLIEAAKQKIGLVICESFRPACVVLPVDRATDTGLLRKLSSLSGQLKQRLWEKMLTAKCWNQYVLASHWAPHRVAELETLKMLAQSKKIHREAECARLFWRLFAQSQLGEEESFKRGRYEGGSNALFNYAYAVLLSQMLQKLLALGIDPTFGIFHLPREHATPLAYDLMEPFRVIFDAQVVLWMKQKREEGKEGAALYEVTREFRQYIVGVLLEELEYEGRKESLNSVIEKVCRSFRSALIHEQSGPYQPWINLITKWDGC